jgi:GT2 family glycosyltransferase
VVIPTRNRPELLARCLERLAPGAQTIDAARYEVLVTDDGDAQIARDLVEQKFPWARWTAGPRRGPAANRNHGASLMTTKWLVFTDDDCVPDPGWLAGFVPAADRGCQLSPGRTESREPWRSPLDHAPLNDAGDAIWSCNMLVEREAFATLGGFDERFPHAHMEDVDFQVRARAAKLREEFSGSAVVDHPPRRLPPGRVLGATHYGEVLFARLHQRSISLLGVLRSITVARTRAIRRHPGVDTGTAVASLLAELLHVTGNWGEWNRRARSASGRS